MKLELFTFFFEPERGGFDDAPLQAFIADKSVVSVDSQFFVHEQRPVISLLVTYREVAAAVAVERSRGPRGDRPDWRSGLSAAGAEVFDRLRRWRNARAERAGKPPYVLLTNRQLATIAERRPTTLAALGDVEGVGEARLAELGPEILSVLAHPTTAEAGA